MAITIAKKPIAAKAQSPDLAEVQPIAVLQESAAPKIMSEDAFKKAMAGVNENAPQSDALALEVDALGLMSADVEKAKKLIKEYDTRLKVVRDKLVEDGELVKKGSKFFVEVKAEGNTVRTIKDMALAVKHMGVDLFMKVAKIGLADIDKYLTEAQKAEVLEVTKSETRSIKLHKLV